LPRYVYECTKCRHSYEKLEGWDAEPRQRCPKCRAVSQRIPAAPAIVFKGSGWYSTDNRRSLRKGAEELQHGKDGDESAAGEPGGGDAAAGDDGAKQPAKAESKSDE
jgi:putative FmdB family regulatory protein